MYIKRLFRLLVVAVAAAALFTGCQKYDDSDLRKQIQELRERLASLEAWCSSSQSAIDAVKVLQEAVKNMNSVESIDPFIDADGATGYVITFTNKQTIKLYNGKDGDKVYWRNADKTKSFSKDNNNYVHFILGDKKIAASGNVMSLIDKDCASLTIPSEGCFTLLFFKNAGLTTAPELPATELAEACYWEMFQNCSSIETAPELPATDLAELCYSGMFYGCSGLNNIKVAFTDWREDIGATASQLSRKLRKFRTGLSSAR